MKGDFSRLTFQPIKRYSRVMMQQGRVQLDADWNEQGDILTYYLRALAADLIGWHGGPAENLGFLIKPIKEGSSLKNLTIGGGRYYVDGIQCEVEGEAVLYKGASDPKEKVQPDFPLDLEIDFSGTPCLVYLDVWERFITSLDDDDIREAALGGPDTAGRLKVIWQVKLWDDVRGSSFDLLDPPWSELVENWQPKNRGLLMARAKPPSSPDLSEPCPVSPDARYRGPENQLYRVEIHTGGKATDKPTFKWSRENGSVVFPIKDVATEGDMTTVELASIWRDGPLGLAVGNIVEITDDYKILHGKPGDLLTVQFLDLDEMKAGLHGTVNLTNIPRLELHPVLRRWDHARGDKANAITITESGDDKGWIDLEDGVQIKFIPAPEGEPHVYRNQDYWLIPARTNTGDVEWPGSVGAPEAALPPHGIEHHYAPLAVIKSDTGDGVVELRKKFKPLAK